VIDARDVLERPGPLLRSLCESLGVAFSDAMLSWPAGRRETDGVWAKHWYAAVEDSTGFRAYRPKPDAVPDRLSALLDRCMQYYRTLYEHRLRPA
jgi:hypothetical protein